MKVKTVVFVNERTADGRPFTQAGGVEVAVDDSDEQMVALVRSMIEHGLVESVEQQVETVDDLRVAAEAAGVKIDKRWGVDRLRDEIAAAEDGE